MLTESAEDKQINGYLLGNLPESEVTAVEIRLFKDADFLGSVRAAEDDLIDAYLGQELAAQDKQRFEQFFAAVPHRQEKIAFARGLITILSENETTLKEHSRFGFAWISVFRWPLQYATVALVLALAVVSFLLYSSLRKTRQDLERSIAEKALGDQEREALRQRNGTSGSRAEELSKQLEAERSARLQQEQRAQQLQRERDQLQRQSESAGSVSPSIATFVLSPGFTRGSDEPTRLVIQPPIKLMRLQLDLESGDEYKSYRAELRTTGGNVVWSREGLQAQSVGGGKAVVVSLPVVQLNSGEYELTLRARNSSRGLEDIGYYYFSVLKR